MKKIMIVLGLALLPSIAGAISTSTANGPYIFNPSKVVAQSSVTINLVAMSGTAFTIMDTAAVRMDGADFVLLQSTYAGGVFCCSFESSASSSTATTLKKGCVSAAREPGGTFYEFSFRRWWQNLRVYCASLDTATPAQMIRVLQAR